MEEIRGGDKVVVRWIATGRQQGRWDPRVPSPEGPAEWTGISIYRVSYEPIVGERVEEDLLHLFTQIRVVAETGPNQPTQS